MFSSLLYKHTFIFTVVVSICLFFRAAVFQPFRSWLCEVLGLELEPTVDISCAKYEYTGELSVNTLQTHSYIKIPNNTNVQYLETILLRKNIKFC